MKYFYCIFVLVTTSCVSVPKDKFSLYYSAPPIMEGVAIDMNTPGYWISKIDNPDRVIMDPHSIELWNKEAESKFDLVSDISNYNKRYGSKELKDKIYEALYYSEIEPLVFKDGSKPDKEFYETILDNMNLEK